MDKSVLNMHIHRYSNFLKKQVIMSLFLMLVFFATSQSLAAEPDVLLQLHPSVSVRVTPGLAGRQTRVDTLENAVINSGKPKHFDIGVQTWTTTDSVNSLIQKLVDLKSISSPEIAKLDHDIAKMRSPSHKAMASTKDSLNHTFSYQATDPSSRAGRMILDEPLKKYNLPMAEYQRQKIVDKIHTDVVAALLQISFGFGMSDKLLRTRTLSEGVKSLSALVGETNSNNAVYALHAWLKTASETNKLKFKGQNVISILEQESIIQAITKEATAKDTVVQELTKKLNRYAHPGAIKAGTSKVIETTLSGIAMVGPGFAIPLGAEGVLDGYLQLTGGSEESKLEKELSISQRIRSRVSVLGREAAMGLENYRFAQVSDNASLRYFSQGLLGSMTSQEFISAKLNSKDCVPHETLVPSIIETIDDDD